MEERNYYNELVDFISSFYEKQFKKKVPIILNKHVAIEDDLNITGDDADIFLTELAETFNLNVKNFNGAQYFGSENESSDFIFPLLRLILGQRNWMPVPKSQRK